MSQFDDLNAVVTLIQTDVATVQQDVQDVIVLIHGQTGNNPPDFTDILEKLNGVHATLGGIDTSLKGASTSTTTGEPTA